ncbi:hypothetical protein E2C01_095905 [Portunus trituberculatus]|uniref:Uncharacterized protein n=1 Tax=Portunus trituberculatus TaxID=210409 RepID=A0A5B7JWK2_PORTR|nr:hypothetical protein [Portunus trituberculatus]
MKRLSARYPELDTLLGEKSTVVTGRQSEKDEPEGHLWIMPERRCPPKGHSSLQNDPEDDPDGS